MGGVHRKNIGVLLPLRDLSVRGETIVTARLDTKIQLFRCCASFRFRKRYAGEYEGLSTAELAVDLRRDVGHYRELWKTGKQADTKVWTACLALERVRLA